MEEEDREEKRLRSVALQNAQSIHLARQRAEEELRKQSEWLRITLASIGDAVISTDADGRVTFLNGVAESLTGWTQAAATGRPLPEVFHIVNEHTRLPAENPALRALREGTIVGLANHTVLIAKDGTERPIDDSAAPIRDGAGAPVGAVLVFRDVTERKRAEQAQLERGRLVALRADVAVALASGHALREILQHSAEAIVRHLDAAFARIWTLDETAEVLELQASAGLYTHLNGPHGRVRVGEYKIGRLAKSRQPHLTNDVSNDPQVSDPEWAKREGMVAFAGYPLAVEGRMLGVLALFARHALSETVLTDLAPLADTVAQCIERVKMVEALREADRKKDEFIALLAHELRNPLAPLRNGLQVMRLAAGDANAVSQVRAMMDRQLGHMVRLIDDLLDISRISQNKMELRRSRVVLTDVVNSAVETARPAIEAAGHELMVSLPAEPVYLDADLTRLAQVFSNLLTNSAKYTERGGRIWLVAELRIGEVIVSVRDSGIGIPSESLPRIFDMFSQVDRSIERSSGGLGIGLALVKGLVEMHDGTVSAASAGQGKGSTFTVKLPALGSPVEPSSVIPSDDGQAVAGPRRRILVVDDNRDSATSMALMLNLMGNDVRTVHDGLEAVEAAEQFRPQVILMDVGMPRLSGLDATRRIREQPWGKKTIVIALTGWGQDGDRARSKDAGCDGHLVKPVDLPDLEKLLSELVDLG